MKNILLSKYLTPEGRERWGGGTTLRGICNMWQKCKHNSEDFFAEFSKFFFYENWREKQLFKLMQITAKTVYNILYMAKNKLWEKYENTLSIPPYRLRSFNVLTGLSFLPYIYNTSYVLYDDNDKNKNVFFSFLSYLERHSSDAVLQLCVTINFYMTDFLRTHKIFNIISTKQFYILKK